MVIPAHSEIVQELRNIVEPEQGLEPAGVKAPVPAPVQEGVKAQEIRKGFVDIYKYYENLDNILPNDAGDKIIMKVNKHIKEKVNVQDSDINTIIENIDDYPNTELYDELKKIVLEHNVKLVSGDNWIAKYKHVVLIGKKSESNHDEIHWETNSNQPNNEIISIKGDVELKNLIYNTDKVDAKFKIYATININDNNLKIYFPLYITSGEPVEIEYLELTQERGGEENLKLTDEITEQFNKKIKELNGKIAKDNIVINSDYLEGMMNLIDFYSNLVSQTKDDVYNRSLDSLENFLISTPLPP